MYLDKYIQVVGYKDLSELLGKQPKEIENDLVDFIISLKERGCKHSTIINYVKLVVGCCKVNDIVLNVNKVNRFMPKYVRNKNTRSYNMCEIQAMLDVADERLPVVILLASSCGLRIGSIPDLSKEVASHYKICTRFQFMKGNLSSTLLSVVPNVVRQ